MSPEPTLPSGWQWVPIRRLGTIHSGGTPTRGEPRFWRGDIPWVTPGEITRLRTKWLRLTNECITQEGLQSSGATLLPSGTVLVTSRATIGATAIATVPVTTNQGFKSVVLTHGNDPRFFFHQIAHAKRNLLRFAAGSTFLEISLREFSAVKIPTAPPDEQRGIADLIDSLDELIAHTEAEVEKRRLLIDGIRHDLLRSLPPDCVVVPVGEVGEVQVGRQRSPKYLLGDAPVPYLRVANVFDGWIDYGDVLSMDFTLAEREIFMLRPGDVLLNEGQSIELVGRSAIYEGPPNSFCYQNSLIRFRSRERALPKFCQSVFKYWLDTGRFIPVAKQTTSIAHLGTSRFAAMKMPLPTLPEQQRIVAVLDDHDAQIRAVQAERDKLVALKRGLLDDLLTGRVRVPAARME